MKQKTIRRYKFTNKRIQFIVRAIIRVWRMHSSRNQLFYSIRIKSFVYDKPREFNFPQPIAIRDLWTIIFPREMFDNALINEEFAVQTLLAWKGLVFPMYRKN